MNVSLSRAKAGEEIILTRHGQPAVRLQPVTRKRTREEKLAFLLELQHRPPARQAPGWTPLEVRIFCTGMTVCQRDRRRYLGADRDFTRQELTRLIEKFGLEIVPATAATAHCIGAITRNGAKASTQRA